VEHQLRHKTLISRNVLEKKSSSAKGEHTEKTQENLQTGQQLFKKYVKLMAANQNVFQELT